MELNAHNLRIAATILAKAATFDSRVGANPNERALMKAAWCEALDDGTTIDHGTRAVTEHHKNSTEYLTVGHINRLTRKYREVARPSLHFSQVTPPDVFADDPAKQRAWVNAWWDTWTATEDRDRADVAAWGAVGGKPPRQIGTTDLAEIKRQIRNKYSKKAS